MSRIVDKAFTDAYNESNELYDKDELEKCIKKPQEILADGAAPCYHRMKVWILLGNCFEDCGMKLSTAITRLSLSMWHIMRRWNRAGEDAKIDANIRSRREGCRLRGGAERRCRGTERHRPRRKNSRSQRN